MYFKLALRNAKRSAINYLLYIFTVTSLVSIMCVSNCFASFGSMKPGFQTAALPLLIVIISVVLTDYINIFMIKQRAKELATYMLLGIEQNKLSFMFLLEFIIIGAVCFLLGAVIGLGIFYIFFHSTLSTLENNQIEFLFLLESCLQTLFYFCIIEVLSSFRMKQKLSNLQISRLMNEKHHNQSMSASGLSFWSTAFLTGFFFFIVLLCGVVFLKGNLPNTIASFIMLPILFCIFAFYKWVYALFSSKRLSQSDALYKGNLLYHIAEMTSGSKTNAVINTVFCACLLLSSMSFAVGMLMLTGNIPIFTHETRQWMGVLQISICIIFIVIYFFILSLLQIIELKRQITSIQLLHFMGRNKSELKLLVNIQVLAKLLMPAVMCFIVLIIGIPLINHKLNDVLPMAAGNSILYAEVCFGICFIALCLCYFFIINMISRRFIKTIY